MIVASFHILWYYYFLNYYFLSYLKKINFEGCYLTNLGGLNCFLETT